jgi:alpha-tubulin suppressor-like RCC1 family protein
MTWTEMGKRQIKSYKAFMQASRRDRTAALHGMLFALVATSACGDGESIIWRTRTIYSVSPAAGKGGTADVDSLRPSEGGGGSAGSYPLGGSTAAGQGADGGAGLMTDGGAGGQGGDGEAVAGGPSEPMDRCYSDDDCDDGLYCNGVERCLGKSEGADIRVCKVPETGPCGPSACDEASDSCDCSDPDQDNDSFPIKGCAGDGLADCDDLDEDRRPRNAETCDGDPAHDEDCRDDTYGDKDVDGDLFVDSICSNARWYQPRTVTSENHEKYQGTDCHDELLGVNPRAEERCDNEDNNCNGIIDEVSGAPLGEARTYYKDGDADHWGDARDTIETLCNTPPVGYTALKGDCNDGTWEISPAREELCNGKDDDCDGTTDQPLAKGGVMVDEPVVPGTEYECTGRPGWKVKTCPPDRLDCGNQNFLDGCETIATTLCNCRACGTTCSFSCGESACEEIQAISAGSLHTCALVAPEPVGSASVSGSVACWGSNGVGTLGNGTTKGSSTAVRVQDLTGVTQLASGDAHSCAIAKDKLYCWGSNDSAQLGYGGPERFLTFPSPVEPLEFAERAVRISAGSFHSCAIYDQGLLACWGDGEFGQLGIGAEGTDFVSAAPMQVLRDVDGELEYIDDAAQVAAGKQHTCAITSGRIECWGDNSAGQLGISPSELTTATFARAVPGLGNLQFEEIVAAAFHSCARSVSDVYCWGRNADHELASDDLEIGLPVRIELPARAVGLAAGRYFVCALTEPGEVYCWGSNFHGERGTPDATPPVSPTRVALSSVSAVFGGNGFHVCAKAASGAWCWGRNDFGQLGAGSTFEVTGPAAVSPLGGVQGCSL